MEEKKYTTMEDHLKNGCILKSYGTENLVSVCMVPKIHMVRISVVKIGTSGKDKMDFYLSIDKVRLFCGEIDDHQAAKKIASTDPNGYPNAYNYVSGTNGSKELHIGNGQKGIRVQVRVNTGGKWVQKMSVISMDDLKNMSFYFKLVTGLVVVRPGSYYDHLVKCYDEWVEKSGSFSSDFDEEMDGDYRGETNPNPEQDGNVPDSKSQKRPSDNAKENSKSSQNDSNPPQNKKEQETVNKNKAPNSGKNSTNKPAPISVTTVSSIKEEADGSYVLSATKGDGEVITITIEKKVADELGDVFTKFKDRVNQKSVVFRFSGKKILKGDGTIRYKFARFEK